MGHWLDFILERYNSLGGGMQALNGKTFRAIALSLMQEDAKLEIKMWLTAVVLSNPSIKSQAYALGEKPLWGFNGGMNKTNE